MKVIRLIFALLLASLAVLGQSNTFGTFKKNNAKSKYEPAGRPGTDIAWTRTFTDLGNGWVRARSFKDASKAIPDVDIIFKRDGKNYLLWTRGVSDYVNLKFVKVGKDAWQYIATREGQTNTTNKAVESFSADGKTYTVEVTGTGPDGKPRHDVEIWERQ
jgi:hypothetical protein